MIGKRISHYKILEKLGGGGMGVVYKAEDTRLKRVVALKFLPPELSRDSEAKERFIQEAQAASAPDHLNICTVHEIDETEDGQLFIVMACYEGETLKAKIAASRLTVEEAVNMVSQVASGLSKAHQKGIIHRDIKPANIFVTEDDEVKIVDFGLAKLLGQTRLTKTSSTMGTAAYMSPEQARGKDVDHRSDIWSLGVVLYEMLAGQAPFKADYEQAMIYSIVNEAHESLKGLRADLPEELERIVNKALAKAPAERYQDLDEMLVDLQAIQKQIEMGNTKKTLAHDKPARRKPVYLYGGLAVILALVVFVSLYFLLGERETINSIAVLPLENLSGDPEQEYFVDGMTEALITELCKIEALEVISRQSVMQFKGSTESLRDIAKKLDVAAIIEGSAMKIEDRIRITAQLIDAASDRHLWAEDYERDLRNVFALQKEIAHTIASEINIKLTAKDEERIGIAQPVNSEAHDLYLKGQYFLNRLTATDFKKGIDYFRQAIKRDSNYALAYAGLAEGYAYMVAGRVISPKEGYSIAIKNDERALEIDDSIAEAHRIRAWRMLTYNWDWQAAENGYLKALDLSPNSASVHQGYSWYLLAKGQYDLAILESEKAKILDPFSPQIRLYGALLYYNARRYDQMMTWLKDAMELWPDSSVLYCYLGWAYMLTQRFDEAVQSSLKAVDLSPDNKLMRACLAVVYGYVGEIQKARAILDELENQPADGVMPLYDMAKAYVAIGEIDRAFECLDRAYAEHSMNLFQIKVDPLFDSLQGDPRFDELLKKIGLEP